MTDAFLKTCEHGFLVTGVDVDDTVRMKTHLSQGRREQILLGDAPQDLALGARGDSGGEQGGCGAVDGSIATSRHFVQRPERKAATR